ncbi:6421_t:CDS:2, partial [Gigaspora margarita]
QTLKCQQRQTSNLSQDSFPSIEGIKKSGDLYLTNSEIEMINKSNIAGEDFLLLNEDDLYRIGLSIGSVKRITLLMKEISRTSRIDRPSTDCVHVYIDNSNIWIEEKYTIENLERLGTFDLDRSSDHFKQLQIDHGKLLTTVQDERKLGGEPFLVGSRPPTNDSL